jgi:hypothetical protein
MTKSRKNQSLLGQDNDLRFAKLNGDTMEKKSVPKQGKLVTWLKRIGVAGFLFFLIKGLVWIFVIVFLKGQLQC